MYKLYQSIVSVLLVFTLSGCFGETSLSVNQFTDPNFEINYLDNWITKTKADFGSNIPASTIVTFSEPEPQAGYQKTISIISENLPPQTTSLEYAQANINSAINNIIEFEKIEERDIMLGNSKSKLLIFSGKSNLQAKSLKYIQTYAVKDQTGYTITASSQLDTDETILKELENLVTSFKITEEQKVEK